MTIDSDFTRFRYSPKPVTAYVRTRQDGLRIGPGANEDLVARPGAWNLYWLSFPELEAHTDLGGGEPPILIDPLAAIAIETASQTAGAACIADLASNLPAALLIEHLARRPIEHLALAKVYGPENWLALMRARAALTTKPNETRRGNSSTIRAFPNPSSRSLH